MIEDRIPVRMRDGSLPKGVATVGIDVRLLRRQQGYVRLVQSLGGKVHVWTVDRDEDVELCLGLGVDAIITNRPRHVLERLGRGVPSA